MAKMQNLTSTQNLAAIMFPHCLNGRVIVLITSAGRNVLLEPHKSVVTLYIIEHIHIEVNGIKKSPNLFPLRFVL